jgi:hypothetical protein
MSFQPIRDAADRQHRIALLAEHPDESPAELDGHLPYLIHPPGKFSPTARFTHFRDSTLLPMIEIGRSYTVSGATISRLAA